MGPSPDWRPQWTLLLCDLRQSSSCLAPQFPQLPTLGGIGRAGKNREQLAVCSDQAQHETNCKAAQLCPCAAGLRSPQGSGVYREGVPITSPSRGLSPLHGLLQFQCCRQLWTNEW